MDQTFDIGLKWKENIFFNKNNAFKVLWFMVPSEFRKYESLFCKIKRILQKTITCTGMHAEQMFSVNI